MPHVKAGMKCRELEMAATFFTICCIQANMHVRVIVSTHRPTFLCRVLQVVELESLQSCGACLVHFSRLVQLRTLSMQGSFRWNATGLAALQRVSG